MEPRPGIIDYLKVLINPLLADKTDGARAIVLFVVEKVGCASVNNHTRSTASNVGCVHEIIAAFRAIPSGTNCNFNYFVLTGIQIYFLYCVAIGTIKIVLTRTWNENNSGSYHFFESRIRNIIPFL